MKFQPIKQISAIVQQEYFEPTITWAFRVVLALNVPLIVLPLWAGFTYEVTWAAFGAYMLSLIDYRGLHSKKILVQSLEAILMFGSAIVGMNVAFSITLSIVAMFFIGMFAALIRNWSNYGSSIGVAVGFFFLFGLSNPISFEQSLHFGLYTLIGSAWAIFITLVSFPLRPSNPVKRSVAKVWKANTEFLDVMIQQLVSDDKTTDAKVIEKEMAVRAAINESLELFARRQKKDVKARTLHYDMMMELRHTSSLFSAALTSLHEKSEVLHNKAFDELRTSTAYKTLSALAQASARMSIVIFTFRPEDLTMAKIRIKRCGIALGLLREACEPLSLNDKERADLRHYMETLDKAYEYLQQGIAQIEEKLHFNKSDYLENYKLTLNNFLAGLNPDTLVSFVRSMMNVNSQQFRYALRVALALSIGVFIFKYFHINHGHWIALTIIIVIQPYYSATLKKGIERIVGTVAGIVLGGVIMLLPLPHEAFVGLLVVVSFFVAYFLRNNYKIGVFFVTIMMVILMQISQQATWQLIGWRILSTLIGAVLAVIAGYAFWPVWEKQRFPALMSAALAQNKQYLQQVILYFNKDLASDDNWHKHRRLSEAANNDVFACAQRMYEEPQHIQEDVSLNYALVGANIRVSREITSIALISDKNRRNNSIKELDTYYELVSEIIAYMSQQVTEQDALPGTPDFKAVKDLLASLPFEIDEQLRFMKSEFEKIIFELETMWLLLNPKKQATTVSA